MFLLCLCSIFSIDFDGDNDKDLVTTNYESSNISILLNEGDGTFTAPFNYPIGAHTRPISVFAADLDGDCDNDLAVADWLYDNVTILVMAFLH